MKTWSILLTLFLGINVSFADTPPPPIPNPIGVTQANPALLNTNSVIVNSSPIPVTGTVTTSVNFSGPTGSPVPVNAGFMGAKDGSGNLQGLKVNGSQALTVDGSAVTQPVSATSLPLPTGAATNSSLTTINTTLGSPFQSGESIGNTSFACTQSLGSNLHVDIDNFPGSQPISGSVSVSNFPTTQAISAASLPLPTGAATSALQTTGNTALTTINTTLGTPFQAGGSIGNTTFACTQSTGSNLHVDVDNSVAVTGTFFQTTQPVSASSLPLPTGAATAAKQPALGTAGTASSDVLTVQGIASMTALKVDGSAVTQPISAASLPLPTGAATSALQTTGNTALTTINTTLGSPFQSGGSIGNTSFVANAGTNLNTSALALETGGNLATTATNTGRTPINLTGSGSGAAATVSTVTTLTSPSNAIGFVLMNLDTSTANIRWAVGRTASTTLGQQLQPGRDTGFVPIGASVSVIAESGTQNYDIQWIAR